VVICKEVIERLPFIYFFLQHLFFVDGMACSRQRVIAFFKLMLNELCYDTGTFSGGYF